MNIVVKEELKAYIDPLTKDELAALERSLLSEGCRDALVLWGEVLVDGHNRYSLCQKHGLPFRTVQNTHFKSMDDVHLWMIDQHLGRRSVSDFQRGVLALRKREILSSLKSRRLADMAEQSARAAAAGPDTPPWESDGAPAAAPDAASPAPALPEPEALNSREALAKAARLSSSQVALIEKIQKQAAPEVVAAVRAGTLTLNAAAAVATLPAEEQVAAAQAGAEELKLAARRARDAKRKPVPASTEPQPAADGTPEPASLAALQQRIAELTAENQALRQTIAELQTRLGTA